MTLDVIPQLRAQVGSNNPTGVSGIFNGNITTGGSYDPYTGNATRTITDIVVAGAVGEYPLAFSRSYNSRNAWGGAFGLPGGWHHNYQWVLENSTTGTITGRVPPSNYQPPSYTVDFPDGRTERFVNSPTDTDPYCRTTAGVRDRFQPLNLNTKLAYLILTDGGKVEFKATLRSQYEAESNITYYWYTYVAQAIIDPYGLRTAFSYDGYGRLSRATEPAGRYLQFYYRTTTGPTISQVTASDGRTVQYNYINSAFSPGTAVYTALTSVVYYSDATWTARYTYRCPNVGNANGLPLLLTADDPMYSAPMKRIAYTYKTGTNQDGTAAVFGQIQVEKYYDGVNPGAAVSTLTVTGATTRTETRGDGETRTFLYLNTGYLTFCTD